MSRHGKPACVLIGFESEDNWFDYRPEDEQRFLRRGEAERQSSRASRGVKLEDLDNRFLGVPDYALSGGDAHDP